MYLTLVHLHYDYFIPTSSPYLRECVMQREGHQSLVTRVVEGLTSLPCEKCLGRLRPFSLERRRIIQGASVLVHQFLRNCAKNIVSETYF